MHSKPNITHLILSGGGFKGFVYLGVLRYLYIENMIENIKYIAGTSIGAYFATIIALKVPVEYFENEMYETIKTLNQNSSCYINNEAFHNLFLKNGMLSLDFLLDPVVKYIQMKYQQDDITFLDFIKKTGVNIYCSCSNVNTGKVRSFSADDTPYVSVIDAVRASMSIPFLFKPVEIDGEFYVDGYVTSPLDIDNTFSDVPDGNKLFICLNQSKKGIKNSTTADDNIMSYSLKIFSTIYKSQFEKAFMHHDKANVILFDDLPYDSAVKLKPANNKIVFDVSEEDLSKLILVGFIGATQHFNKLSLPEQKCIH